MSTKSLKGRKKRKAARRRKQLIAGGIYIGIMALGVGCMVLLSRLGSSVPAQEQWMVPDATVEIAAPAERSGPVVADRASDSSSALTLLPLTPTHALTAVPMPSSSPAPTAVPTATPSPVLTATPSPVPTATPSPVPTATPAPTPRTLTLTAAGDCTLGGSVHQETYARFKKCLQQNGYNYFFSNVRHVFEADDLTIVNLEGPLTNVGRARQGSYVFKGDPDYVQILTGSSVELCNVANNHSRDFGTEGLEHTREILQGAGIGCCGYTQVYRSTINGIRVSALGYLEWEIDLNKIVEAVRQERPNCDLLIVNMHWGREKHYEPVPSQKKYGHAIIDAGADLILGTHPHVYGGVELYKGRYIVYSLGNFCFGGNTNPSDKRALMFRQTFVVDPDGTVSDGGIDLIPCSVSSTPRTNDYRPTIMSMDDGLKLLNAVGKYSNITPEEALWLRGSYAEQSGLVTLARSVGVSGEARS